MLTREDLKMKPIIGRECFGHPAEEERYATGLIIPEEVTEYWTRKKEAEVHILPHAHIPGAKGIARDTPPTFLPEGVPPEELFVVPIVPEEAALVVPPWMPTKRTALIVAGGILFLLIAQAAAKKRET